MDDLRHASFAQALPHLTQLSKDESFLKELLALKVGSALALLVDRMDG